MSRHMTRLPLHARSTPPKEPPKTPGSSNTPKEAPKTPPPKDNPKPPPKDPPKTS